MGVFKYASRHVAINLTGFRFSFIYFFVFVFPFAIDLFPNYTFKHLLLFTFKTLKADSNYLFGMASQFSANSD